MLTEPQVKKLNEFINIFIEYPLLTTILNDFERLRINHAFSGERQCMLLTGDTGSGKSSVINHYKSKYPAIHIDGIFRHPVLVSRIPSRPTLESTIAQLLSDLGQVGTANRKLRHNDFNLTDSLISNLKSCGTELIIINEFQELVESNQGKKRNEIANRLKYLNEEAGIPIVLVGMPWAEQIAEEPQWSSRLMVRRFIPYFKISEDLKLFVRVLMGLAARMPFCEKPRLQEQDIVYALFAISKGCFRTLKQFLNEAVKQTLLSGAKSLTKQHLSIAFEVFYPNIQNPFKLPVGEITACEVEKYSVYHTDSSSDNDAHNPTRFTEKLPISLLLKK